jgi:serine protease Do
MPNRRMSMPRRWSAHRGSAILMVIFVACRSEGRAPDAELVVEVAQERSETLDGSRTTAIVEAAARVAPAVVSVNVIRTEQVQMRSFFAPFPMPRTRRSRGLGSGFIIDAAGVILTNDHVVRDAERIMVTLPDGRDFEAELVGTDQLTDVAVLRIQGDGLPVAHLGTSEGLLIGEWSLAIGNPFGNLFSNAEPSVTAGVISATGRHIIPADDERVVYFGMIQTDASINPGNSGGPLVNSLGEVIGVNSSIFSRSGGSEGLGFAIPIDRAWRVASDLMAFGEVKRAWLGFEVDADAGDIWGRSRGVAVSNVSPSSPAARAGISRGDRVMTADGRALRTQLDFESLMLDLTAGESLSLDIDGREEAVTLVAVELPSISADRVIALEQMELVTVTLEIRTERNLRYESGALIVAIERDLEGRIGLREGDVILQINRTAVASAEQAAQLLRQAAGNVAVYVERNGEVTVRQLVFRRSRG